MQDGKQAGSATTGVIQSLRALPTYAQVLIVVALVVIVAALVALVYYLVKRPRTTAAPALPADTKPSLASLWDAFIDDLPPELRFSPVAVVFGGAQVGKSWMIQACADWKSEQKKGYQSAPADTRLQLYKGRDLLVQEVSWDIIKETEGSIERKLKALWAPLRGSKPVVVVTLKASALSPPEDLKSLASLLRHKLDILTAVCGAPLSFRLCLTHLDELDGFRELVAVMGKARGSLVLSIKQPVDKAFEPPDEAAIRQSFDPLRPSVDGVLTTRTADDFRLAVNFFEAELPPLTRSLTAFLGELLRADPLRVTPTLDGLYLSGKEHDDHTGNPLSVDTKSSSGAATRSERRAQLIGLGIAAAAGIGAALLLGYHSSKIDAANASVTAFEKAVSAAATTGTNEFSVTKGIDSKEVSAASDLREVLREDGWPVLSGTAAADKAWLREHFLSAVRNHYLVPRIRAPKDGITPLYTTGLLYASAESDLGKGLALPNAAAWANQLVLPEAVIRDYVELSATAWTGTVVPPPVTTPTPAADVTSLDAWDGYLQQLGSDFASPLMSAAALGAVRTRTAPFLDALKALAASPDAQRIAQGLASESPLSPEQIKRLLTPVDLPPWVSDNQATLTPLLRLVGEDTSPTYALPARVTLSVLMTELGKTPAVKVDEATYAFELRKRAFKFLTLDWANLLNRSRSDLLVDAFCKATSNPQSPAFFTNPTSYAEVGRAAVPGKGPTRAIQGMYTRAAFDAEVSPALQKYAAEIDKAPLSPESRRSLATCVNAEVEEYATAYSAELSRYYASFELSAGSIAVLQVILAELAYPSNWLTDLLNIVADNASLDLEKGDNFELIGRKLASFAPIVDIAKKDPKEAKYAELLGPLMKAGGSNPAGETLNDRASPIGQQALLMLKTDKDSLWPKTQAFISASGLAAFEKPFSSAVKLAYSLGSSELFQIANAAYRDEITPKVSPVLSSFPFQDTAEQEAQVADIQALFLPEKGTYWASFNALIAPLSVLKSRRYTPLSCDLGQAKPPAGALDTATALVAMGEVLWADGKPRSIPLSLRALPLPESTADQKDILVPTLAVLRTGKASFFGFNQRPAFEAVEFLWWDQGASAVELQLSTPGTQEKRYRSIEISGSLWSFHRLLMKTSAPRGQLGTWTWSVPVDPASPGKLVQAEMHGDPWAPFRVPFVH
jgi:type VI secretion system protein ImpL